MAFPTLGAQQETNRKILEDLQLKKQLLQKGVSPVAGSITGLGGTVPVVANSSINQMPSTQFLGQPSEFTQSNSLVTAPRSVFNPTSTTTLGYFITQDSYYGNTFIPVLPRLDPLPQNHPTKKLEEYLQGVEGFEKPKILLEQYPTPPHIASCVLYNIQTNFDDIDGKLIGDLGCGSGMLSIGSFLLGAQLTIGFEIDGDAINVFRNNVTEMELPSIDCIQADVLSLPSKWFNAFDTIVTNPPFGTKHNAGMDMRFVESGIQLATGAVYSLHKSSTREYILKKAKEWNVKAEVVAELRYNIEASYKFHKKKSVDIEVDFWRLDVANKDI